ncbi:YonK family protein [Bacillus licheniformis]|uniref:YonK family protein n=1 Tax=Bacillus licheniformis TaxID=1402 RepID=UPI001C64240D|nr:YonK family protein [Bacillus licheniformis]MBW7632553.1 YonK family protein [Bacillus licheniformis]MED4409631.1 YonK family protein [Bacillus licheniformis]
MAKGRSSKKVNQVNLKGFLDMDLMEITEQIKEDEYTYDLRERLYEFNGKNVSITIKEENELPVKEAE